MLSPNFQKLKSTEMPLIDHPLTTPQTLSVTFLLLAGLHQNFPQYFYQSPPGTSGSIKY